jgi:hypothetical protein
MLKARHIDSEESPVPWFAVQDARMRSYAASTRYTDRQKIKCEAMKLALELVYRCKEVHLNYRNKFVAIKIDAPSYVDRKQLKLLEGDWGNNVEKILTAQGIIYRVKFS